MASSTVSVTSCFIDQATFNELTGFIVGGPNAITWFVASVQKCNWFSFIPIALRNIAGNPQFNAKKVSASVSRQGDYVLSVFFRARIPQIGFKSNFTLQNTAQFARLRWVNNLMHNLIQHVQIEFNDLSVQEFESYWLDGSFEFRTVGQKRLGYLNMIGQINAMIDPVPVQTPLGTGGYFSVPLPFFFGEDSGVALPVAALPFNDVKITYDFRDWRELIMVDPGIPVGVQSQQPDITSVCVYQNGVPNDAQQPQMDSADTFAHYAIVHNDERVKMGDAPRDILIHQVQQTQIAPFKDVSTRNSFDIRLSHDVVHFYFMAKNNSLQNRYSNKYGAEQSNYTTLSAWLTTNANPGVPLIGADPIAFASLYYENTTRLAMASDYYSLINPWFFSIAIPENTGYHMWSYALLPHDATRPSGMTGFSKLANVSISYDCSLAAQNAALSRDENGNPFFWPDTTTPFPQTWEHIFVARNFNILRVANGTVGFPTL